MRDSGWAFTNRDTVKGLPHNREINYRMPSHNNELERKRDTEKESIFTA